MNKLWLDSSCKKHTHRCEADTRSDLCQVTTEINLQLFDNTTPSLEILLGSCFLMVGYILLSLDLFHAPLQIVSLKVMALQAGDEQRSVGEQVIHFLLSQISGRR